MTYKRLHVCVLFAAMSLLISLSADAVSAQGFVYQERKAKGLIAQPAQAKPAKVLSENHIIRPIIQSRANTSSLLVPFDSSFTLALAANDDQSTDSISLQFPFRFYDSTFSAVYINNNGNISLEEPFSAFTSTGFPVFGFPMVAPFWADVDTRGEKTDSLGNTASSGLVYYKSSPNRFVVTWLNVGYYSQRIDKRNTFQLIITDGTDSLIGIGNNVAFSYGDMQWTTGDASDGVNGFGGTPATAGINRGDGAQFALIGRFDTSGTQYTPTSDSSGVDFLDGKIFSFSTQGAVANIPPIAVGFPQNNLLSGFVGDTLRLQASFLAPELSQQVFLSLSTGNLPNAATINGGTIDVSFFPRLKDVGDHILTFTASDNGAPAETTVVALTVRISNRLSNPETAKPHQSFSLAQNYPNPFNPITTIQYQLPAASAVNLSVFDMLGRTVAVLVNERQQSGDYQFNFLASEYNLSSGVYFYRLQAGSFTETKQMILVK